MRMENTEIWPSFPGVVSSTVVINTDTVVKIDWLLKNSWDVSHVISHS